MVEVIPKQIKDAWDTWNIRGMIILSLSLQIILIFFAPLRKRTPNKFLILLLWSSYLLADLSANFAVALIAKNQGKDPKPDDPPEDKKLVALWAPFLLLHLGGPDTITAFSLEDNALWNRHFLGLVFQALAGVYVVIQSLPNVLWVVILLLFIAGTSKYLERTIALYLASSDKYRNLMLDASNSAFDYTVQANNLDMDSILASEMYMKEHHGQANSLKLKHPDKELTDLQILQFAFLFFNNFTSLMVNNIFSLEMRDKSKAFFSALQLQEEALSIIEAELEFIYEGLYTKGAVLHSSLGIVIRVISVGSLVAAFTIYHDRHNKIQEFQKADIIITYTLFAVGIALEFIFVYMFMLSDGAIAALSKFKDDSDEMSSLKDRMLEWILGLKRKWKGKISREEEVFNTPFLHRRWTGNITMFNFLTYSMNADTERIHNPRGRTCQYLWKIALSPFRYVFSIMQAWSGSIAIWFCDLHRYIIHHVIILPPGENQVTRSMINIFKTFVEFWLSTVPYFLAFPVTCVINFLGIRELFHEIRLRRSLHHEPLKKNLWSFIYSELKIRSQNQDSQESATTKASARRDWASSHTQIQIADHEMLLRYITDVDYDHSLLIWHIATELCYQEEDSAEKNCDKMKREISKIISDYMMYLLMMQPKLMSDVSGIGNIRFRDTLAEADRFFTKKGIRNSRDVNLGSKKILSVDTSIEPSDVKGNHCKSVLFEASSVAKELLKLEEDFGKDKWEVLSKVWLEFLMHAASHSDGTTRLELLSKGGEFINFVWLLMAHFGLGD
ncbi:PREDICTED: uncharacterized protein LOC104731659 [Camelina sativa]|uniref:Uncharacterized protein LOC104731659 n=1 Tax=Camelina sativa TaxID=90675 RepID=A0ABM0V1G6_CAMSA|nr:PREDICTED: uncharacterized protein LOC104731659 [Camelina sativa]